MGNKANQDEEYEKLRSSQFKQQRLPGWRPVPSVISSSIVFLGIGIVFIGIGVFILLFSSKTKEIIYRYDNIPSCIHSKNCSITIPIEDDMDKKIMIYYQLDGFYQNFRRYMSSKSIEQLHGKNPSEDQLKKDCEGFLTNDEMGVTNLKESLKGREIAIPCGLMAKNFFNDSFTEWKIKDEILDINENNIARDIDKKNFRNSDNLDKQWIDITNEHFMVWMRPAPFSNFRKLWGRIDRDLKNDENLTITIQNNYNVTNFEGAKYIVLTTVNVLGGKNIFLAYSYIVIGGICVILGIFLVVGNKLLFNKEK